MNKNLLLILLFTIVLSFENFYGMTPTDTIKAYIATKPPVIDGKSDDSCWLNAKWYAIDQPYLGGPVPSATDFQGRYKVSWDTNYLYLFVEIVDDSLYDYHPDRLTDYWTGDVIEIFFDENRSKGNHQCGDSAYNAFAYHISPSYYVIDLGKDCNPLYLNDNITVKMDTVEKHKYDWEFAVKSFTSSFDPVHPDSSRIELKANQIAGLTIAYGDNDGNGRKNFMGSTQLPTTQDVNYITADYFGLLDLVDPANLPNSPSATRSLKTGENISFFPNPATDLITVLFNGGSYNTLKMIDLLGRTVKSQVIASKEKEVLNVSDLRKGFYVLQVLKENSPVFTDKVFIK